MHFASQTTALFFVAALNGNFIASLADGEECTHGVLFISDANTTSLRAYDLDQSLANLVPSSITQVPGKSGQFLQATGSRKTLASMYRGTESLYYADGTVNFINTGVSAESHGDHVHITKKAPTVYDNAGLACVRPIHFVNHDNKVAIFCDGNYDAVPEQLNSTVWVVDETLFGVTTTSSIVYNGTLQGSHHGVSIPVDDKHLLHSLAVPDRINRNNANAYALPSTFQVVDYEGNVLHSIADTTDPNTSCSGFHGSSAVDNTFSLACDAGHGGIVVVNYDNISSTYTSRALSYPLESYRTGTFAEHHKSPVVVGNFAGGNNSFSLLAFDPNDKTAKLSETHVQKLSGRQCSFDFDQADPHLVIVFLQTGMIQIFNVKNGWSLVKETMVIEGMLTCSQASMVTGYGQAFITEAATKTLYALDYPHPSEGIEILKTSLGFLPNSAVVAGVPDGTGCLSHNHNENTSSSASFFPSVLGIAFLASFGMLH